ncbi:type I pullulanase [Clostridium estertheticum]|uniref:type I pullulanase n=1 Tax=Clostridium estertheticum TaxID=238834 RepID=UPI001CF1F76F|nr:type I pullulanase [Clostridium estertheticum]MCB2306164.1 type I pullulanase [Clostridium estertheticum]MCB2344337.1 type I pullulanase [Clostridium estertheticum]MCB2349257.1 type I pullulanase [Clostridium estertheticum]WAG45005.1 type I pullulanase [Clostridium estertheticum]
MNFWNRNNKRNTLIIFLTTVLVMTGFLFILPNIHTFAQSDKTKIIIHYARNADNNSKWKMWLWSDKKDGNKFDFTSKDSFGQIGETEFGGDLNKVGFIIYTNEWKKDTDDDRFIEKFKNGVGEVWINGGDPKIYYSLAEATKLKVTIIPGKAINKPNKFISAKLNDLKTINIETNVSFPFVAADAQGFTVKSNGKALKINKITSSKVIGGFTTVANIELSENVNLNQTLTIAKTAFPEKEIAFGDVMQSASFEKMFSYEGNDLGNTYSTSKTSFKVWAPTATEVKLVTYEHWNDKTGTEIKMKKSEKGTWSFDLNGNQSGIFYTYKVNIKGVWNDAVDPYARSVSANGDKGAVVDLKKTDPTIWKPNEKPDFSNLTDAIIYELHVRDFSIDTNSGIKNKGKFLAFTEMGTKGIDGNLTGIDYIKSLGVTHVELMPIFDYSTINETSNKSQFNWGYNPKNYNAPEGSYSTNPYNPTTRVKELKQAVQALHDNGLRVNVDVAYDHMYSGINSNFNKIVPGYYFRTNSNESGYGNTIASENVMARKFIVDSVIYWAKEYNLDGFKFDQMGLIDLKTMNEIRKKLSSINPSILVLGDGSDKGTTLSPDVKANKQNASKLTEITQFNDEIRDGLSGSVFLPKAKGFINGALQKETAIKKGIVGGIDYSNIIETYGNVEPVQIANYTESHANNTLWDKLLLTNPKDSDEIRTKMHKMADSMILTSQGIPFFQAGQEFLRTKSGVKNSYKASDNVNKIDWTRESKNIETVDYFKGLIELRKAHPAFRMTSADMIKKNLKFLVVPENVVAYEMNYNANMDSWAHIVVAYNANREDKTVKLSNNGTWNIVVDDDKAGVKTIKQFNGEYLVVPALSSIVAYYESENIFTSLTFRTYIILALGVVAFIMFFLKKRKKI